MLLPAKRAQRRSSPTSVAMPRRPKLKPCAVTGCMPRLRRPQANRAAPPGSGGRRHQRVQVACAGQLHGAAGQTACEVPGKRSRPCRSAIPACGAAKGGEGTPLPGRWAQVTPLGHHSGQLLPASAIAKPLPGHMVVRQCVQPCAAAASSGQSRACRRQCPGRGVFEAAVGRHQQARALKGFCRWPGDMQLRWRRYGRRPVRSPASKGMSSCFCCAARSSPKSGARRIRWLDTSQPSSLCCELVVDDHGKAEGPLSTWHRAGEKAWLVCHDAIPDSSQIAQDLRGMLGQRDFAPVIGRVFNGAQGCCSTTAMRSPWPAKRTCQAQARRAGAADQDVIVHGV